MCADEDEEVGRRSLVADKEVGRRTAGENGRCPAPLVADEEFDRPAPLATDEEFGQTPRPPRAIAGQTPRPP